MVDMTLSRLGLFTDLYELMMLQAYRAEQVKPQRASNA